MFAFSPGCCCTPEARCVYTGRYSEEALYECLANDYRADASRILPWYLYLSARDRFELVWEEPASVPYQVVSGEIPGVLHPIPESSSTITPNALPWTNEKFNYYFNDGLGSRNSGFGLVDRTKIRTWIFQSDGTWRELQGSSMSNPWSTFISNVCGHPFYLQILSYHSQAFGEVTFSNARDRENRPIRMTLLPLNHLTGSGSMYYDWLKDFFYRTHCRYFSVALLPSDRRKRQLCLIDCGLYTCSGEDAGTNSEIVEIVPYPTPTGTPDWGAIAADLARDETYPNGYYYYVWGNLETGPGYARDDPLNPEYAHFNRFPTSNLEYIACTTAAEIAELGDYIEELETINSRLLSPYRYGRPANSTYCGLYKFGRPILQLFSNVIEGEAAREHARIPPDLEPGEAWCDWWHEGRSWNYIHQVPTGLGGGWPEKNRYIGIERPQSIVSTVCPVDPRGLLARCQYATLTNRRWLACTTCHVVECRCPQNMIFNSRIPAGKVRRVEDADYYEVRSAYCNANYCTYHSARPYTR